MPPWGLFSKCSRSCGFGNKNISPKCCFPMPSFFVVLLTTLEKLWETTSGKQPGIEQLRTLYTRNWGSQKVDIQVKAMSTFIPIKAFLSTTFQVLTRLDHCLLCSQKIPSELINIIPRTCLQRVTLLEIPILRGQEAKTECSFSVLLWRGFVHWKWYKRQNNLQSPFTSKIQHAIKNMMQKK